MEIMILGKLMGLLLKNPEKRGLLESIVIFNKK